MSDAVIERKARDSLTRQETLEALDRYLADYVISGGKVTTIPAQRTNQKRNRYLKR